jgi:hypothetical protein
MKLLLSSKSQTGVIRLLNAHFYSTTYDIMGDLVTWKGGQIKDNLTYKVKKGRHLIYQS